MNSQPNLHYPAWLVGVGGSPYTRKLRSILRFRRIPYRFVVSGSKEASLLPDRPLPLLPYLVLPGPDGEPATVLSDTTPIIDRREELVTPRPLRPADPALRLLDLLFEDYGDEWLSKCMFHYRWANAPDTKKASSYIPYGVNIQLSPEEGQQFEAMFARRQISRIGVVGSNATTAPIIDHLEEQVTSRSLRAADPALRLLDLLFEDYGDEWLSKCMFHYRWANATDTKKASSYIPYGVNIQLTPQEAQKFEEMFARRQISRIGVVGSNATTAPIIEASWRRWLQLFDRHIQGTPYLLGARPGAGDFACYGQMTQLVITDPTPGSVALEESPRAYAWTERLEGIRHINGMLRVDLLAGCVDRPCRPVEVSIY